MMSDQKTRTPRKPVQSGERFGRLVTQLKKHQFSGTQKVAVWTCVCDCGNEVTVRAANLTNDHTKSCGCIHSESSATLFRTHGAVGTTTYKRWRAMISRCQFKNDTAYANYGGKGVTVCNEWQDFPRFLADMGECPDGMTLDRIDNSLGYSKENCRWASIKQQQNNRTDNRILTAFGMAMTMAQWAEKMQMNYGTLFSRIERNKWPLEKALTEPVKGKA